MVTQNLVSIGPGNGLLHAWDDFNGNALDTNTGSMPQNYTFEITAIYELKPVFGQSYHV